MGPYMLEKEFYGLSGRCGFMARDEQGDLGELKNYDPNGIVFVLGEW